MRFATMHAAGGLAGSGRGSGSGTGRRLSRVAGVVALVVCGGLSLSACRTSPTAAAYVGDQQISEARVDSILDEAKDAAAKEPGTHAPPRSDVVTTLVLGQVCRDTQKAKGFPSGEYPVQQVSQREQVPVGSRYAAERTAMYACLIGLPMPEAPRPSDEELRLLYDRAKEHGLVQAAFADVKDQWAADTGIAQALTVQRVLVGMVDEQDVTVNPRYRPVQFPISDLGSGTVLVSLPLGEPASGVVVTAG